MRRWFIFGVILALTLPLFTPGVNAGTAHAYTGTAWTAEYFSNPGLAGPPIHVRLDSQIAFDWGGDSPVPGIVPPDNFSVRWTGGQQFSAGTYTFYATVDDGVRVFVDDIPVIDAWYNQVRTTHTGQITLTEGSHWVRVEYYDAGDQAVIFVRWLPANALTAPGGWAAEYYNNTNLQAPQAGGRLEEVIDYNWGSGSPIPGTINTDNFSARWWGFPEMEGGTYTFIAGADDGVRVYVDDALVIDAWSPSPYQEYRGTITINPGVHTVRVEYFEVGDQARITVYWIREGAGIPSTGTVGASTVTATVAARALNVRTGPGITWPIMTRVYEFETYTVIGRNAAGTWYQISGPGFTGWVSGRYIRFNGDPSGLPVTDGSGGGAGTPSGVLLAQSNASLRIRRGPGTNHSRIAALQRGETATVIGRTADSTWLQIRRDDGLVGWVSVAYVTLIGDVPLASIPVTG